MPHQSTRKSHLHGCPKCIQHAPALTMYDWLLASAPVVSVDRATQQVEHAMLSALNETGITTGEHTPLGCLVHKGWREF